MNTLSPPTPKRLIGSVLVYMALALIAGAIVIAEDLPAEFGGSRTGLTATQDFFYGMGTALSPPFYTLVIQLALLWLAPRRDAWGTVGVVGLALIGLMTFIGALSEPINLRIFNPAAFDPPQLLRLARKS